MQLEDESSLTLSCSCLLCECYGCLQVCLQDACRIPVYCRSPSLGALLGMELKRGLTALGLRQAELEFYLWSHESPFPFVQLITDMHTGGVAFYKTGTTADGIAFTHVVCCRGFRAKSLTRLTFVRTPIQYGTSHYFLQTLSDQSPRVSGYSPHPQGKKIGVNLVEIGPLHANAQAPMSPSVWTERRTLYHMCVCKFNPFGLDQLEAIFVTLLGLHASRWKS